MGIRSGFGYGASRETGIQELPYCFNSAAERIRD